MTSCKKSLLFAHYRQKFRVSSNHISIGKSKSIKCGRATGHKKLKKTKMDHRGKYTEWRELICTKISINTSNIKLKMKETSQGKVYIGSNELQFTGSYLVIGKCIFTKNMSCNYRIWYNNKCFWSKSKFIHWTMLTNQTISVRKPNQLQNSVEVRNRTLRGQKLCGQYQYKFMLQAVRQATMR